MEDIRKNIGVLGGGDLARHFITVLADGRQYIDNIYIFGTNKAKAISAARDASSRYSQLGSHIKVWGLDYNDTPPQLDLLVSAASVPLGDISQGAASRSNLLPGNAQIVDKPYVPFIKKLTEAYPDKFPFIAVASNPVYALTTFIYRRLVEAGVNIPPNYLCGTGSRVDTDRLRYITAETLGVPESAISGYRVIGDHGVKAVPDFSSMRIDGVPFADYYKSRIEAGNPIKHRISDTDLPADDYRQLAYQIAFDTRREGFEIIKNSGKTLAGPACDLAITALDLVSDGAFSAGRNLVHNRLLGTWFESGKVYLGLPSEVDSQGVSFKGEEFFDTIGAYEGHRFSASAKEVRRQVGEMYKAVGAPVPREYAVAQKFNIAIGK